MSLQGAVKRLSVLAAAAALLGACQAGPETMRMTAVHAAAIRDSAQAVLDAFRRYSAEGQWDSLGSLYADEANFRWLEQGVVQYRSPAILRQALRRVPPGTRIETSYNDTQVVALAPGVASITTAFRTQFVDQGRPGAEFGGVLNMTLVHREAGWRILVGHSSSRPAER